MLHMVFTTDELFEVATESWPEWDVNPQPLKFVQRLYLAELLSRKISVTKFLVFDFANIYYLYRLSVIPFDYIYMQS